MPALPRPGKQSLFDMVEQNKAATTAQAQSDENAKTSSRHQNQYTTTPTTSSQKHLDPEISSIFTQSTIDTGNPSTLSSPPPSSSSPSSRFSFLRRNKPTTTTKNQDPLIPPPSTSSTPNQKEQNKKPRFENPFKPHQQTEQDRVIMERLAKRLGSREEAVRLGGAQSAGFRGVGGGYAAGGSWTGGM